MYNGSLACVIIDTAECKEANDPLMAAIAGYNEAEFGGRLREAMRISRPDIYDRLAEYAIEDWGGEVRFMVAVLGLMNTRNVVATESVDNRQHNVKRIKRGKLPLFSHKLLKVRGRIAEPRAGESIGQGHRELRLHFVQGHFKHRKTGLFYWSWHARGDKKVGFVEKDYEVDV
jgi:hypothetical protein